jgi:hypothetical protein
LLDGDDTGRGGGGRAHVRGRRTPVAADVLGGARRKVVAVGVDSELEVVGRGRARVLLRKVHMARRLRYAVHAGREGLGCNGGMERNAWPGHGLCRSGACAGEMVRSGGTARARRQCRRRHGEGSGASSSAARA